MVKSDSLRSVLLSLAILMAAPVAAAASPPARPAGPEGRLAAGILISGEGFAAPVDLAAFAQPKGALAASGRLQGRLVLDVAANHLTTKLLRDAQPSDMGERGTLPAFDFALIQDGQTLIPAQRGLIAGSHPAWDWVLEPGRVWREAGDKGWQRAALPFALKQHNADCVHNGVMTFLYKPGGQVSNVAVEIASETCTNPKFDAWGVVKARFIAGAVSHARPLIAAYRREVAARLPVRPLTDLARLYPGFNPSRLALAPTTDGDPPSAYGLVADGVLYAGPCQTRHGDYPYCDVLDLPSYSTAKSIVGAVGLMRLEALRPGVSQELIRDHVPACAQGDAWDGVTLANALDMATGIYNSAAYEADENNDMGGFFRAESHADKIAYTCQHFARRAAPETTWVYHTADLYTLGAAMNDIDHKRGGKDYYDDVVQPLWRSLRLSETIMGTRRTLDAAGQPWTAFGLTYHADDIVRVAGWLSGGAKIDGKAALDPGMLAAALQRDPARPGLDAGTGFHYKDGFWARSTAAALGCDKPLWIPFMSGFGGISVVILPRGMTYYYFGDGGVFDWTAAAVEANKIKPMCP